jgi:alpha-amylase/alpha-mannosidase (GH57 family)
MPAVSLAFFWHQHQPYYPDDVSGETLFPWVRLHGAKDYIGMALHVREVPEFRCTINLVPSLLDQILRYTEREGSDRHLDVSRRHADSLSHAEGCYLLDNFFMANLECMIRPHPRYYELYLKRGPATVHSSEVLPRFSERDLRDLQVWNNLTWFHPLLFESDGDLRAFRDKGRGWTEDEKHWLLARQIDVLRQIIPAHRALAEGGQVELTTTPYYHPILPLLWDKRAAREAMPGCPLPRHLESYPGDVARHLELAVRQHQALFGAPPRGLWPSEGSVSHQVVRPIFDAGIHWIATDEEILSHSTEGFVSRDGQGHVRRPEMLYRPWRVDADGASLQIVFRDHGLSDLIGFHYQRNDPRAAADDLLGRVTGIGRAVAPHNAGRPALVPIILDGENCWEYYPDGGVGFLRRLYRAAAALPEIRTVRISDHLQEYPAADRITRLFAGSWISHNFAIWIGHEEDRTAWDLLHETRAALRERTARGDLSPETERDAWRELSIAEGSDWFWWYGEDHSSAQDQLFDQMFRKHLQNVYTLMGESPPPRLQRPIKRGPRRALHTQPRGFLEVHLDGRGTFFEWINAGRYDSHSERGTMTRVAAGLLSHIDFGFDAQRLFVRIDAAGPARLHLSPVDEIVLRFLEPAETAVSLTGLDQPTPTVALVRGGAPVSDHACQAAIDDIVELEIPLVDLGLEPGDVVSFIVDIQADGHSVERAPAEGGIELTVPAPDFDRRMWQA